MTAITCPQAQTIVREENLLGLQEFCSGLNDLILGTGATPDQTLRGWQAGASGMCVKCGARISGEELYALCTEPEGDATTGKTRRLRLGYCVNSGCEGWVYRLEFRQCPELDWARVFEERQTSRQPNRLLGSISRFRPRPMHVRIASGLALVLLLLIAREWRLGKEIPLIRPAQHFKVDTVPKGAVESAHGLPVGVEED